MIVTPFGPSFFRGACKREERPTIRRMEEARGETEKYLQIDPDFSIAAWEKTEAYADPMELKRFTDGLRKAGLPE